MTPRELRRARAELALTRSRRELLFWTMREWIALALLAGAAVALLVALVEGSVDAPRALASAGMAGAGAAVRWGARR
jgi:hypothetical protein